VAANNAHPSCKAKQQNRQAKQRDVCFVGTLDESKLPSVPDAADDYCEYSDFPFETMLGIIASELSEKDAKTFNDVFVLKRDREQVAAEYGISPEALRQRARRVEMKVRLIVSKLLG